MRSACVYFGNKIKGNTHTHTHGRAGENTGIYSAPVRPHTLNAINTIGKPHIVPVGTAAIKNIQRHKCDKSFFFSDVVDDRVWCHLREIFIEKFKNELS
jgi:hypothetical protein